VHAVKVEAYAGDRDAQTARLCEVNGCLDKVSKRATVTELRPESETASELTVMYA
jgi:hypothetical protein